LLHKQIGFYNRDEKCLQRGTDWAFKYSSLRFVFKGLMLLTTACLMITVAHWAMPAADNFESDGTVKTPYVKSLE
jgi:hypothetical protein